MKIRPPQIALIYLILAFLLHLALRSAVILDFNHQLLGAIVFVTGGMIMFWAFSLFKRHRTSVRPTQRPQSIVLSGPFEFTRNPMYLGITLMLTGIACWVGSLVMFIAPGAFFITINSLYVPYEEKLMARIFGEKYLSYKQTVRRWL